MYQFQVHKNHQESRFLILCVDISKTEHFAYIFRAGILHKNYIIFAVEVSGNFLILRGLVALTWNNTLKTGDLEL
jgi:hypothetical protein